MVTNELVNAQHQSLQCPVCGQALCSALHGDGNQASHF